MRYLLMFLIVFSFAIGYAEERELYCTRELHPILEKIEAFPEGKEVIEKVLEQGPLSIQVNTHLSPQFEGYWDAYKRTIYISKNSRSSNCSLITTLLFELHNALRTSELERLYSLASKRAIERKQFIEEFEYVEYENAWATSLVLERGSELGYFPYNCSWDVDDNFADHFKVQQRGGHSALIGALYDQLAL